MQALQAYHRKQLPEAKAAALEKATVQLCPTRAGRYTKRRPVVIDELILLTEVRLEVLRALGRLSVAGALEILGEITSDLRAASVPQGEQDLQRQLLLPTEPPPLSPAYWENRRAMVPPPLEDNVVEEQMIPATPSSTMAPDSESQPPRDVALAPSGIAQAKAG